MFARVKSPAHRAAHGTVVGDGMGRPAFGSVHGLQRGGGGKAVGRRRLFWTRGERCSQQLRDCYMSARGGWLMLMLIDALRERKPSMIVQ